MWREMICHYVFTKWANYRESLVTLTVAQDQPKSSSKSSRNGHDSTAKLPTIHPGAPAATPRLSHAIETLHPCTASFQPEWYIRFLF